MVDYLMGDQNQVCYFVESGTWKNTSGTAKWLGLVQTHEPNTTVGVMNVRYEDALILQKENLKTSQKRIKEIEQIIERFKQEVFE